jgi:alkanesulfonate monooxygenase SsuD/methylene tetrahydromethanopterin reductase-like flavin-dependent oxidoreductase (luciferase family)
VKFATVYPGHVDLPDMGQLATPANERRYSNEVLSTVFQKTEEVARLMDECGYHSIWLAEHARAAALVRQGGHAEVPGRLTVMPKFPAA